MNHKYKRCAWHNKPKKRINETLGLLIAKKYSVTYVKPTLQNRVYVFGKNVGIAMCDEFKSMKNQGAKYAEEMLNMQKKLLESQRTRS